MSAKNFLGSQSILLHKMQNILGSLDTQDTRFQNVCFPDTSVMEVEQPNDRMSMNDLVGNIQTHVLGPDRLHLYRQIEPIWVQKVWTFRKIK